MVNDMIGRVLYPEEEHDGEDGEHDQGLGDHVVHLLFPVMGVEDVRVSKEAIIGTTKT